MYHQVRSNILRHLRAPNLAMLVTAVSLTAACGVTLLFRDLRNDPTVVLIKKNENPYPWLHVPQNKNIKLYAVNRKFDQDKEVRKSYILDD
eukprot:jgi/Hompol1/1333/HPOL_002683-RA